MKIIRLIISLLIIFALSRFAIAEQSGELCSLKSPNGLNAIYISLDNAGQPLYRIEHKGIVIIENSPLGLRCSDGDYAQKMALKNISTENTVTEKYKLIIGINLNIEKNLNSKSLIFKNEKGSPIIIDLKASDEGIGFRYKFPNDSLHTVLEEMTGFRVAPTKNIWLQPYHCAGPYTPAYEDFYFDVQPGDLPTVTRAKWRGWCLPGLFNISANVWMLIAESGTDGSYCACHLKVDHPSKMYQIEFAYEDEVTGAEVFDSNAKPEPVSTNITPWRVIVIGDEAADIFRSTLITDLAPPSKIGDTSWIKPGRASWSWWSHPERPDTKELYNHFTDLAAEFGWEYTLFDAGWWDTDLKSISDYAESKNVKPLAWMHAVDFYESNKRNQKLDEMTVKGIKGVKIDFWCSDRQEAMAAIHATIEEAAKRKLIVVLHGCTVPRGWHRTWPNLLSAEAVLGTECYFFESRYPEKVSEFNTLLPFIRNVSGPMDNTPVALTVRKYPRKITAVQELAAAIISTTGIIHYAESPEVFKAFPEEVKQILKQAPAAWDETKCLVGEPGKIIVLARRKGDSWFIAGINGTKTPMPVSLNFNQLGNFKQCIEITEGKDSFNDFAVKTEHNISKWQHQMEPFGGFVLSLESDK